MLTLLKRIADRFNRPRVNTVDLSFDLPDIPDLPEGGLDIDNDTPEPAWTEAEFDEFFNSLPYAD